MGAELVELYSEKLGTDFFLNACEKIKEEMNYEKMRAEPDGMRQ